MVQGKEPDMPVTSLDERFSSPNAVATSWDETRAVLAGAELFWVSTVRADGRPHITPVVAVWLDDTLHFATGSKEQKTVNLSTSQHVILMTGCNSWESGMDVVVEGDAARVTDGDMLQRLAEAWTTKWGGSQWKYVVGDGCLHHLGDTAPDAEKEQVWVYSVAPAKVLVFTRCEASGHTSHRF
jgi:general stress protein 26